MSEHELSLVILMSAPLIAMIGVIIFYRDL